MSIFERTWKQKATKPRGDQYVDPPKGYQGELNFTKFNGYKFASKQNVNLKFLYKITARMRQGKPVVICVDGPQGMGKSMWSIRFAEIIDKLFDIDVQMVMRRYDFLTLLSENTPLKRGQVIVNDEAQYSMANRDFQKGDQNDLMKSLEAARSRGFVMIFIVQDFDRLDSIARGTIVTHLVRIQDRGIGIAYEMKKNLQIGKKEPWRKRIGSVRLQLPGYDERCHSPTCIQSKGNLPCKHSGLSKRRWKNRDKWEEQGFRKCMNIRAKYERKKKETLGEFGLESLEKIEKKKEKGKIEKITPKMGGELIHKNYDKIERNRNGKLKVESIASIFDITPYMARKWLPYWEREHPNLVEVKE